MTIYCSLIFCLFLPGNAFCESSPPAIDKMKYTLLPEPQQIDYLQGVHKLMPGRFIYIDISSSDKLLDIGRIVQESLFNAGERWELTAAQGDKSELIHSG